MLIRAASHSMDKAVYGMAGTWAAMVVLCGLVLPRGELTGIVGAWSFVSFVSPSRWAVAGVASFMDLPEVGRFAPDAMWQFDTGHLVVPVIILALAAPLLCLASISVLRRRMERGR
jgi:hypothetical protein